MLQVTQVMVAQLLQTLQGYYPDLCLVQKASILPGSGRCTTVGQTIYVSTLWNTLAPATQYLKLQHEMVHLEQFAEHGTVGYLWRYAFPSYRWEFECDAYYHEMKAFVQMYGIEALQLKREYYLSTMSGRSYYWMRSAPEIAVWLDATILDLSCEQDISV